MMEVGEVGEMPCERESPAYWCAKDWEKRNCATSQELQATAGSASLPGMADETLWADLAKV